MRRVSRPRQSPLTIRATSFRSRPKQATPAEADPLIPRQSVRPPRPQSLPIPAGTGLNITIDSITLTLPVPPSVNHQYATVDGRRLLSAKGRTYKNLVGQQILVALAQSPHRATLRETLQQARLSLSIHFFFASALRRDTDGGLKIAQDALCEGLGLNDNRVVETHLYKHQDRDNPRMEIQLSVAPSSMPDPLIPASLKAQVALIPGPPIDNGQDR